LIRSGIWTNGLHFVSKNIEKSWQIDEIDQSDSRNLQLNYDRELSFSIFWGFSVHWWQFIACGITNTETTETVLLSISIFQSIFESNWIKFHANGMRICNSAVVITHTADFFILTHAEMWNAPVNWTGPSRKLRFNNLPTFFLFFFFSTLNPA